MCLPTQVVRWFDRVYMKPTGLVQSQWMRTTITVQQTHPVIPSARTRRRTTLVVSHRTSYAQRCPIFFHFRSGPFSPCSANYLPRSSRMGRHEPLSVLLLLLQHV